MTVQDLHDLTAKMRAAGLNPDFVLQHNGKEFDLNVDLKPATKTVAVELTYRF